MSGRKALAALGGRLLNRTGAPFVGAGVPQLSAAASAASLEPVPLLEVEGSRGVSRQVVKQRMKSVGNIAKITKARSPAARWRLPPAD